MANELILMLYFFMWYLLVVLAIVYSLSAIDDLFIDAYYWVRYLIRLRSTRHYEPLTYEKLNEKEEQLIAILLPCWHEDDVITTMLRHNCYAIDYKNYYIFVGVYPNDPETVKAVQSVANIIPNVRCVIGVQPGPTNKASNLNGVYQQVKAFEKEIGKLFEIFVFHDSEDIIHPLSLKLYNYLIPRKDMVQIPIFPLEVNNWQFTHWVYADEFAENHTKDLIVRESINAHVPSAGVGTGFSRNVLEILEDPLSGGPFATDSLTEDYHTSLLIRFKRLKQIFVSQSITRMRWERKGIFRKGFVQRPVREFIATRALFPMEYSKAVRQKSRWIIGIMFQEWKHTKWADEWAVGFTLLHDRKGIITHFINGFGYIVFLFWLIYSLATYSNPSYPSLQEQLNMHPWVWWLIIIVTIVMCERFLQRAIAIARVYQNWLPALLSIPRTFYSNILNLHAIIRAYKVFTTASKPQPIPAGATAAAQTNAQPAWDKTDHQFPGSHILIPYRRRLGDLLLENRLLDKRDLERAIIEKQKTGERLGQVLFRLNLITNKELLQLLSTQYNLPLFPQSKIAQAKEIGSKDLPKRLLKWLDENDNSVISHDEMTKTLTITIEDPTNELLIEKIINNVKPYKAQFVLVDMEG